MKLDSYLLSKQKKDMGMNQAWEWVTFQNTSNEFPNF
jgi:hypothetical protein